MSVSSLIYSPLAHQLRSLLFHFSFFISKRFAPIATFFPTAATVGGFAFEHLALAALRTDGTFANDFALGLFGRGVGSGGVS